MTKVSHWSTFPQCYMEMSGQRCDRLKLLNASNQTDITEGWKKANNKQSKGNMELGPERERAVNFMRLTRSFIIAKVAVLACTHTGINSHSHTHHLLTFLNASENTQVREVGFEGSPRCSLHILKSQECESGSRGETLSWDQLSSGHTHCSLCASCGWSSLYVSEAHGLEEADPKTAEVLWNTVELLCGELGPADLWSGGLPL